jgi:hypothetical protein
MIDQKFLAFLQSRDASAVPRYLENPMTAQNLYRDPWSANVWWLRQEYDNTARYREDLRTRRESKQRDLDALQRTLEAAWSRPVSSVPTGPFSDLKCKEHHPLEDIQGETRPFCRVCCNIDATLVKVCSTCDEGVCGQCIDAFHPAEDIGFLWFLADRDMGAAVWYREMVGEERAAKRARYTDEDLKITIEVVETAIRRLRNEFYNTADHQIEVDELIVEAEAQLQSLNDRLKLSFDKAKAAHKQGGANDEPKREEGSASMCVVM